VFIVPFRQPVPVVIGFSNHPALADIAERDREIAHLEALDVGP
jgi:hypothetical protein